MTATPTTPHLPTQRREIIVALAGNPNVGKTTLFNAITGLKQKVANYPGVTVEKKEGRCELTAHEASAGTQDSAPATRHSALIVDLPGTYSLASRSPDEHVARQVVLGQMVGTERPDVIVVLADASNLERNLYLVTQVLELGRPTVVALSMMDIAADQGKTIDIEKLSAHLRAPVIPVQAHKGLGIDALKKAILKVSHKTTEPLDLPLPEVMETHIERLQKILADEKLAPHDMAYFDAHLLLSTGDDDDVPDTRRHHPRIREELAAALAACEKAQVDPISAEIETHYAYIGAIVHDCVHDLPGAGQKISRTDRIDRFLTHKFFGMATFVAIMALLFISIFWLAQPIMDFLQNQVIGGLGNLVQARMADGPLRSLITDGIIAGVGNVVVFLPQIAMLFLFLAILEDSGYMSRAAFLMDRVMSKVGLHGKSFIPMLSGYACAVPAIMGTRVIENRRDRLATILVLPLMSCSARLPVYSLVIATFFAGEGLKASLKQGGIMLGMYALGTLTAFALAWVFKRTLLKGPAPAFILEMPPYRLPHWKVVGTAVVQRSWQFLKRAGTLIFVFSVLMWAATHYPKAPVNSEFRIQNSELTTQQRADMENVQASKQLENSFAGSVGKSIAPVFRPLGYDWKLSIGVTGAFFAREVIVSTMGIVFAVGGEEDARDALAIKMRASYSPLIGLSLMVFVVYCMQCLSTLAIVKKETNTWRWPIFMFVYMTALAWFAAFTVYQGGRLLGF